MRPVRVLPAPNVAVKGTMSEPITLELVDADAVMDSNGRSELSRADLLRRAAVTGGALIGGGVLLTGVPKAFAQGSGTDLEILNFLLLNETLEAAFYAEAAKSGALKGKALAFARQVAKNEAVHRDTVKAAVGSNARAIPPFDFKGIPNDRDKFLVTALALEDGDVAANNGAGPLLSSKALLAAAGSIVSVEARQAAWIRRIVFGNTPKQANRQPAPRPFDPGITLAQAKAALRSTGFVPQGEV